MMKMHTRSWLMWAGALIVLIFAAAARAAPVGSLVHAGEKLTIRFGFTAPPSITPDGPVDALVLSIGSSFVNFFGSSYLRANLFDGDTLLATRDYSNSANIGYTLGDCCLFVQPGSPGTTVATIDTNLATLISGTIDGRLELIPVWDPVYVDQYATMQIDGDLSPVKYVGYASYWPADGLEIRSMDVTPVSSTPAFAVAPIGSFGGRDTEVAGLTDFGDAVGRSSLMRSGKSTAHAFTYSLGAIQDLGTLGGDWSVAQAINDSKTVVGTSEVSPGSGRYHAFRYRNGAMHDLGTLGGTWSKALAVNVWGSVVGTSARIGRGSARAFVIAKGVMRDLGTLGGPRSGATGVNDSGVVVGYASLDSRRVHAFKYVHGKMIDLGTLGGNNSGASGVNTKGDIVGYAETGVHVRHAFVYQNHQMTDLGTLGGANSAASAINDAGQVVGYSGMTDSSNHAFEFSNGTMTDLHPFVVAAEPGVQAVLNSYATSINTCGQIGVTAEVLVGQDPRVHRERRAYILKPLDSSCASSTAPP